MRRFSSLLSILLLSALLPTTPWVQWPRADREAVYTAWTQLPETKRPPFPSFRQSWLEERLKKNKTDKIQKDSKIDKIFEKNLAPH